ncbi:hypothetical protein [Lachnobacterium bovis]|uniref:hypothetical protein n=1 Tax=Lachnobacterium bovis TaxID=140626 RepID=UPI00048C2BE0|nr:hypothetical protein [Lachnobacterium bovis]
MNQAILLSSSDQNLDFMVHGLTKFKLFGQTIYITTTQCVCILLFFMVLLIFSIVAHVKLKKSRGCTNRASKMFVEFIVELFK